MKKIKYVCFAFLTIISCFFITSCDSSPRMVSNAVEEMRNFIKNQKYIVHACGEYYGEDGNYYTYTNSKEALLNCYGAGYRVCEIDFRFSSDGQLICTHDIERIYKDGKTLNDQADLQTFLSGKIYGEFTPMWIEDIAQFARKHTDFYIVTDIKDENVRACKAIAKNYPDLLDRFIVQIYHTWEYDKIKNLGFNNMIFTLYRTSKIERFFFSPAQFAKTHELVGFTFWHYWTEEKIFSSLRKTGVPLYIHTVNDLTEMTRYYEMGISGIYTDLIDPSLMI